MFNGSLVQFLFTFDLCGSPVPACAASVSVQCMFVHNALPTLLDGAGNSLKSHNLGYSVLPSAASIEPAAGLSWRDLLKMSMV